MRENQELYTKLSSQTKCISLEIKPVGKTRQIIEEKGIIHRAEGLYTTAHDLFPVLDEFIKQAMNRFYDEADGIIAACMAKEADKENIEKHLDHWDELAVLLKEDVKKYYQTEADIIETLSIAGGKCINEFATECAEKYGIKKSCSFGSATFLFDLIPAFIDNNETFSSNKQEIIDNILQLKGCNILFKGYYTSRIASMRAIAKRIFENFKKYIDNIPKFARFLESEDSKGLLESFPIFESFVHPGYYVQFISPSGINDYNFVISGTYDKDGVVDAGYNYLCNLINQEHAKDKNSKKIRYRKAETLWQQIFEPSERQFHIDHSAYSDEDARTLISDVSRNINEGFLKSLNKTIKDYADPEGIIVKYDKIHAL